ncbi:hypothetical protein MTBBW1_1880007 [Desulfamplus magnetovallimortis]|uniref:Uncharacterized protein n=1 Tax=Desulfamplus magnetovallimortis TaxID=1246637 RepID=A0A1W1HAR4_9BACT|nr:hypothetical protein MTBBW1_1880007 [Desulfamplus magnetovallimortis]
MDESLYISISYIDFHINTHGGCPPQTTEITFNQDTKDKKREIWQSLKKQKQN